MAPRLVRVGLRSGLVSDKSFTLLKGCGAPLGARSGLVFDECFTYLKGCGAGRTPWASQIGGKGGGAGGGTEPAQLVPASTSDVLWERLSQLMSWRA